MVTLQYTLVSGGGLWKQRSALSCGLYGLEMTLVENCIHFIILQFLLLCCSYIMVRPILHIIPIKVGFFCNNWYNLKNAQSYRGGFF